MTGSAAGLRRYLGGRSSIVVLLLVAITITAVSCQLSTDSTHAAAHQGHPQPASHHLNPEILTGGPSLNSAQRRAINNSVIATSWPRQKTYWACDAPTWPAELPAGAGAVAGSDARVLVLGDSLTHNIAAPLSATLFSKGWLPTIDCYGGKTMRWGLGQVRNLKARSHLPERVIVALGTNDLLIDQVNLAEFTKRAQRLLDALGSERQVWWVNLWADVATAASNGYPQIRTYRQYNDALASVISGRPNVRLIDWYQKWTDHESANGHQATRDGIHYQQVGNQLRLDTIVNAL